jgi:release factor glutamine methyltransferase
LKQLKQIFKNTLKHLYTVEELNIIFNMTIENIMGKNVLAAQEVIFTSSEKAVFEDKTQKLLLQIPIQYVLEEADFYGLKFKVNSSVLIPRPETEELVHLIVKKYKNQAINILDIGTGSGCIPISLQKNLPLAKNSAIDISEEALEVAKENAKINRVEVSFFNDDALNLLTSKYPVFDVIVSNPPYIAMSEKNEMENTVTAYEPHLALFVSDENPLIFYDKIGDFALTNLSKQGFLYFEINQALAEETKKLLEQKGFKAQIIKDINNNDRMISAQFLG